MTNVPIKLIVIVGPTAVGKTALSIEIAKRLNGEIISGDAIQVYKGMDIGSAKITPVEMQGIPHYLIDIMSPDQQYSAAQFKKMAEPLISDINQRGRTPMIVGGTGLYIQSVLYDYQFQQETSRSTNQYDYCSTEELAVQLEAMDPAAAAVIHPHNRQRMLRALDYYDKHQQSITQQLKSQTISEKYDTFIVGLNMPRELLYERINKRVDLMIDQGLIQEVSSLMEAGYEDERAMSAIGYKELIPYVKGDISLEDATIQLKQNSRRFAKRQLTWFRNQMDLTWFDASLPLDRLTEQVMTNIEGDSI